MATTPLVLVVLVMVIVVVYSLCCAQNPGHATSMKLFLVFLLAAWAAVVGAKDLYKILGVSRGAGLDEIKRAYKKKAILYHPDKNKDADASDKFIEINQAHEILRSCRCTRATHTTHSHTSHHTSRTHHTPHTSHTSQ